MLNNIIAKVNFYFPNYKTNEYNDCFISFTAIYTKNILKNPGYEFDYI